MSLLQTSTKLRLMATISVDDTSPLRDCSTVPTLPVMQCRVHRADLKNLDRHKTLADSSFIANVIRRRVFFAGQSGEQCREVLVWGCVVQRFPWPVVDAGRHGVKVCLGQRRERSAFGKVLAQEAVGVLVGTVPIGLTPMTTTCRVCPFAGI